MLPEERARVRIDKQLSEAGWDIVARNEYVPKSAAAVKEALMQGNTESDYLLFVDDKAIAVVYLLLEYLLYDYLRSGMFEAFR